MKKALENAFPAASEVMVESDMFGAARAVCGTENGVVGILGTGSNSCVFNGSIIEIIDDGPVRIEVQHATTNYSSVAIIKSSPSIWYV